MFPVVKACVDPVNAADASAWDAASFCTSTVYWPATAVALAVTAAVMPSPATELVNAWNVFGSASAATAFWIDDTAPCSDPTDVMRAWIVASFCCSNVSGRCSIVIN